MLQPPTNLTSPLPDTICRSIWLFQLQMVILLSVTSDHSSCLPRPPMPNPPFLAFSATPKLQISLSWDWHRKPPAPCWRNYLCITLNPPINKRYFSQSAPEIPGLRRKRFIFIFSCAGRDWGLLWSLVFMMGGNQNNILEERVKYDHMLQSTAYTKTDIAFLKDRVLKETKNTIRPICIYFFAEGQ